MSAGLAAALSENGYFPPCVREFKMVAATERRRIATGRPTPQIVG